MISGLHSYQCYSNGLLHACSFGISPRKGITRSEGMTVFTALDVFAILLNHKVVPVFKVSRDLHGFRSFTESCEHFLRRDENCIPWV